ncbi:hypothetical protein KIL84_002399 [Mauremys mutica]|uniref:Uncharacterized protein n=1 Tax=Mauremys mutica TaxID=74926 RepID=A0A9D4AZ89_9SAUR|nr:hypothetical protein KIL84_002399 [Mauremys mutica]
MQRAHDVSSPTPPACCFVSVCLSLALFPDPPPTPFCFSVFFFPQWENRFHFADCTQRCCILVDVVFSTKNKNKKKIFFLFKKKIKMKNSYSTDNFFLKSQGRKKWFVL